jgi:hypothetical protein
MTDSIFVTTKKVLGIPESDTSFDTDIFMHLNTVLADLAQLGVGPVEGLWVDDYSATWDQFTNNDVLLAPVKTYVYLRVRLLFDPPTTSFAIAAMERQVQQMEWRLNVYAENKAGQPWPTPTT